MKNRVVFILLALTLFFSLSFRGSWESSTSNLDVLHYRLDLKILDPGEPYLEGTATIRLRALRGSAPLVLDLESLQVDSVWFQGSLIKDFSHDGRRIRIPVNVNSSAEGQRVKIKYRGQPAVDPLWGGFYNKQNTAFNMGVGFQSDPPSFGRAWYPCHDDFGDRATYDFFIKTSLQHTAVCSGILEKVVVNNDGTRTYHYTAELPIPAYLSSVAVSGYIAVRDTFTALQGDVPFSVHVPPGKISQTLASFSRLEKAFHVFEQLFGPYRWPRVGYVTVPFHGGAMEHAMNIAVSEQLIDGTRTHHNLLVHELAHSWFGNLVTCSTPSDMWLNEGWASYAEMLAVEFTRGTARARERIRDNHEMVLRLAHIIDGDYYAVYNTPPDLTYGTTVYDKGADVIHSLRHRMGDAVFFRTLQQYFDEMAFSDISTMEFRNYLSARSGINLNNFFEAWILSPGFLHFEIDSVRTKFRGHEYYNRVYIRQRHLNKQVLSTSDRMPVLLMDSLGNRKEHIFRIRGEYSKETIVTPFKPDMIILDPDGWVQDAVTDYFFRIDSAGNYNCEKSYCSFYVQNTSFPLWIKAEHHWVAPAGNTVDDQLFVLSDRRYWTLKSNTGRAVPGKARFYYNAGEGFPDGFLDHTFFRNFSGKLLMFYRKEAGQIWQQIDSRNYEDDNSGFLEVKNPRNGYYCFGFER